MNNEILLNAFIAVVVLGLLLFRQLTPRRVQTDGGGRFLLIIGLIGVIQLAQFIENAGWIGVLGVGMLVVSFGLAAGFATIRAHSVRVWQDSNGTWWRRGGALTLVLWLISIGSHFGVDIVAVKLAGSTFDMQSLGNATLLLYVAVSLGLQNAIVARRVADQVKQRQLSSPAVWQ